MSECHILLLHLGWKHSEGVLADVTDLHPEGIGFEAEMPADWKRFVEPIYQPIREIG